MFFFFAQLDKAQVKGSQERKGWVIYFPVFNLDHKKRVLPSQPSPPNQHVDIIACASRACLEIVMILRGGAIS